MKEIKIGNKKFRSAAEASRDMLIRTKKSPNEIAEKLGVSVQTVYHERRKLLETSSSLVVKRKRRPFSRTISGNKVRTRMSIKIGNKTYASRSAAAKDLVASGKSLSEVAELTNLTYPTVHSVTVGSERVAQYRMRRRIVNLSHDYSPKDISDKVGIGVPEVKNILKEAGVSFTNGNGDKNK